VSGQVRTSDVIPLYVRLGDWVGLLCVLATLVSPASWRCSIGTGAPENAECGMERVNPPRQFRIPHSAFRTGVGGGWGEGGVDVGGTFTDLVALADDGTIEVRKVVTTPEDPAVGLFHALDPLKPPQAVELLVHGTTIATNALLERRGARIALVTTKGFEDLLWLRRQDRAALYDLARDHRPRWSRGPTSWGSRSGPARGRARAAQRGRGRAVVAAVCALVPLPMRWPSPCCSPSATRRTSAAWSRRCGTRSPTSPSSRATKSFPCSGSSSARAPPRSRRISVLRSPPISDGWSATCGPAALGCCGS